MTTRDTRRATPPDLVFKRSPPITYYLLPITSPRNRRGGFTLIETALALLAIGLGLMAIFGLGRIGLQTTKESDNDTRCVQMADAVFETLREYNARFVDSTRTNSASGSWFQQWQSVIANTQQIPFPAVANMNASPNRVLKVYTQFASTYDENALSLLDWNPRYELAIEPNNASYVAGDVNMLLVTLVIYPDGDTYSSEYRFFQTTLTNPGGLP